jgi:lysophospholipase L1-like esterase
MMQRPAWWLALAALAALAVVAPFWARGRGSRRPAPEPTAPATNAALPATTVTSPPVTDAADAGVVGWPEHAQRVLHVGDSTLGFTQGLAAEMSARFEALGIHYDAHTEASAGLHTFAASRMLEDLIREKKPDVVLLTLGMNNLTALHPEQYEVDVTAIVEQAGGRPCWWIGPLSIDRPDNGLIAMLARATAPCGWSSSYDLVIERQPDGIHPTQRGASKWADAAWGLLRPVAPRDR